MNAKCIRWLAAAIPALAASGALAAEASVTFVHPEHYVDLPRFKADRDTVLKDLADHFIKQAKALPAGQELKVEVLDLDLAGRLMPTFRGPADEIRVLRGAADWPTMRIRYTITAGDQVLAGGEQQLSNMDYLMRLNRYASGDTLRYEKQMIDDWFKDDLRPLAMR